jgi:hypothetical protein
MSYMCGRLPLVALGLAAIVLSGCGHVPVASMLQLARIDFANTDPARLRAAVKLPRAIEPLPQGVALRIAAKISNGHEEFRDFVLQETSDAADVLALESELEADTRVIAYRLDAGEVARLNMFRDALKQQQAASGGRGGALTISIRPQACRSGELPRGAILITTYLRTAETGGYVTLARNVDLTTLVRDLATAIPLCR